MSSESRHKDSIILSYDHEAFIMSAMDRRLLLNIIIVSILSFYFIFGIVYRGLMEESEPDLAETSAWEQPFLIPKDMILTGMEEGAHRLVQSESGAWSIDDQPASEQASLIANNWSGLLIQRIESYQQLPKGRTLLVFVAEQTAPIVYRLVEEDNNLLLYRLNDKRLFKLPIELKNVIWIN